MKTVQRFHSFEDMKAHERSMSADRMVLKRHRAFQRLLAFIRANVVRQSDRSRR